MKGIFNAGSAINIDDDQIPVNQVDLKLPEVKYKMITAEDLPLSPSKESTKRLGSQFKR